MGYGPREANSLFPKDSHLNLPENSHSDELQRRVALEAEAWVNERFTAILEGKATTIAADMRRTATKRQLSKSAREPVDICADYLLNKAPYLRYNEYLQQGFPIVRELLKGLVVI